MTSQIEGTSGETSSASEDLAGSATTASNLLCAVAPTNPTSIPEIIAALRGIDALHGLADHEYHWLASHGSERVAEDRVIVFREGEPAHHLNIILKGEIYVHRRNSGSISLFIGRTGQITGKLPFSRMTSWGAEGSSSGSLWMLDFHEDEFPAMLLAIPSLAQLCVSILLDRVRDFTRADLLAEKLISLAKLAANLSHELNNPAATAQRAAFSLSSKIDPIKELCRLGRLFRSEEELASYIEWTERSLEAIKKEVTAGMDAEGSLLESDVKTSSSTGWRSIRLPQHGPWRQHSRMRRCGSASSMSWPL